MFPFSQPFPRTVLLISLILIALSGCGQKGDLYLPDDDKGQQG
jgi:predicted small lipoprotein YifL